jgi:hypothetical protein
MQNQFSYYFDGVRHTSTELEFLRSLVRNCEDPQGVIEGILESKARFDDSAGDN